MKCPHCGIHYMDGERECPVCGKRSGLIAPKKKSKFSNADMESTRRTAARTSKPAASTERKQTYSHKKPDSTEAAWQKAANGAHSHDNPLARAPRGKSNKASGCLIVIVALIAISVVFNLLGAISYRTITDDWNDFSFTEGYEESVYESCDLSDAVPSGTWVNEDDSLTFVVDDAGTVSWSDGAQAFADDYPLLDRLNLTEDNADEYCTDDELESYPISSYTKYQLWASVWDDAAEESHSLDLCLYLPLDTDVHALTSFDYYDRDADEYHTFTRRSDETALPDAVMTAPDAQPA